MISVRVEDHALGLELQLEEAVEQRRRAEVQGRTAEVDRLGREISGLLEELAAIADLPAGTPVDGGFTDQWGATARPGIWGRRRLRRRGRQPGLRGGEQPGLLT